MQNNCNVCIVVIVYAAVVARIVTATVDAVCFWFFLRSFFCVAVFCACVGNPARRITNVYNFADLCQCLLTLSIEQFSSAKCREAIVFPIPVAFKWTSVYVIHTNSERKRESEKKKLSNCTVDIIEFIVTCIMAFISSIFILFSLVHRINRRISTTMSAKFNWISTVLSNLIWPTT